MLRTKLATFSTTRVGSKFPKYFGSVCGVATPSGVDKGHNHDACALEAGSIAARPRRAAVRATPGPRQPAPRRHEGARAAFAADRDSGGYLHQRREEQVL